MDGMAEWIKVRGAREHNLKNIDVDLPRNQLVVITGLSGSGKSTLAFDTIFAEGQRRYVESLSVYARQFLGQLEKPDVDSIDGLSPAIAIDQKGASRNPRSTVGTMTEVYDFLRLLYARVGEPHCPFCDAPLRRYTPQQMIDAILALPEGSRVLILAPVARERKGDLATLLDEIRKGGFVRVRINGEVREIDEPLKLEKYRLHTVEVVVDRLVIRAPGGDGAGPDLRVRLADSVETGLKIGSGELIAQVVDGPEVIFSERYRCPNHGLINLGSLEPRDFSFNNPQGACPTCTGLGEVLEFDPGLIIPERGQSLAGGAVAPWAGASAAERRRHGAALQALAKHYGVRLETPLRDLPPEMVSALLYGTNGDPLTEGGAEGFEGVIPELRRRLQAARDDEQRAVIEQYMAPQTCPDCHGTRLRPEVRAVRVGATTIALAAAMTVDGALAWVGEQGADDKVAEGEGRRSQAGASVNARLIAVPILAEIERRLRFLSSVGLGYLTLDRSATTLSGGEAQRIRLASQVGAGLSGVLYVLDEPSIGLHPRDHGRLLETLINLRDLGNSVLVVEHDADTIRAADWVVDIGPGAGEAGGRLIASGPLADIVANPESITGQFLSGARKIPVPKRRRSPNGRFLELRGARAHNLKKVDVRIPLGVLVAVTGVSGSGKSSLVLDTLYARLAQQLHGARERPGPHDSLQGIEHLDKVIAIDQAPIGRTPRSNPATYSKVFDPIRNLFAATNEAKARGYDASRFSFNVKGGRCEHCGGEGLIQVEMQFLPDLFVPCEVCGGARYNRETLDIRYRGKTIAEVLDMTVAEATAFFERVPAVYEKLQTLQDVGLGYVRLGQPATTLSGGEAQRIKLASELARRATGRTLYVLDEPTTGLHFADIERLLAVLQRLVDAGNTVLVIEHNLDVIRAADWVIDVGPEGGTGGGTIVAVGTPEQIATVAASHTGRYLREP
jgi:excinuclease ABC subunit A